MGYYDDVRLGLFARFRVWREQVRLFDFGKELEKNLLNEEKIRLATRDARKEYRKYIKYEGNDGLGQADFIEQFLVKEGLKEPALPEGENIEGQTNEQREAAIVLAPEDFKIMQAIVFDFDEELKDKPEQIESLKQKYSTS